MIVFCDDPREFIAGRDAHLEGSIANADRNPRPDYLVLHRATCPFLPMIGDRRHRTKDGIKICGPTIADFESWAAAHVSGYHGLQPCLHCNLS